MAEGIIINENGSISNRIVASNIKEEFSIPDNVQFMAIDCETPQHRDLLNLGSGIVNPITIGQFGMAGLSMNAQRCAHSLKTRIHEAILKAEERSIVKGHTLKLQVTTIFPTGTSATVGPIAANVARSVGLDTLVFAVIPDNLSQSFQLVNTINAIALSSFTPLVLVDENFAEMLPSQTQIEAGIAAGGNPSKFYTIAQHSLEFGCKLARLISGSPEKMLSDDEGDDLSFLDTREEPTRNQSKELATAISGKNELFVMHYNRSRNNDFEQMGTLKPSIQARCPGDPIIFAYYDSTLPEDDVSNALLTSLDTQDLKAERLFLTPSDHNEVTAFIPTKIPQRLESLINCVKKDKSLDAVMKSWAKKTILSNVPPIRRGYEDRIVRERLGKMFFKDDSEFETLVKKLGFSEDIDELKQRNFLFHLAEEHGVFLKPLEVS